MRKVKSLQQIGLGTGLALLSTFGHPITVSVGLGAIATLTLATPAEAAILTRWQFNPSARELEITVPEGVTPRYFLLAQPARIVLDLPNTSVGSVPESQTYAGAIRQIRVGEFQPGLTRIVIELSPDAVLATGQVELRRVDGASRGGTSGSRWVLRPLLEGDAPPVANRPQPAPPAVQVPTPSSSTPAATPLLLPSPQATPTVPAPPGTGSTANLPSLAPAPPLTSADLQTPESTADARPTAPVPTALASPSPASSPTTQSTAPTEESSSLPPLEPNALEIPIDPPRAASPQPSSSAPPPQATSPQELDSAPSEALSTPTAETTSELAVDPAAEQTAVPAEMNERSPNAPSPSSPSSAPAPNSAESNERSPNVTFPFSSSLSSPPPTPTERGAQSAPIPSVPSALPLSPPSPTMATAPMPTALPPSNPPGNSPVTVQVPPLASGMASGTANVSPPTVVQSVPPTASSTSMPAPVIATQPTTPASLPPAVLSTNPTNRVTVPPLNSPSTTTSGPASPSRVEPPPTQQAAVSNPEVLLSSGTVLSLRYPRDTVLQLQAGNSWQEVLVVAEDVRDRSGAVVVPEGSQVIGRFETSDQGSRFITQAITVQGRNVQLRGQSEVLAGDRQVSDDNLVRNSAIGGAAFTMLGLLTGGIGFLAGALAGAAAGAATTYITAPQPAIIQPNQVVEVRLSEDVPRVF
jgi:hypothetical protein